MSRQFSDEFDEIHNLMRESSYESQFENDMDDELSQEVSPSEDDLDPEDETEKVEETDGAGVDQPIPESTDDIKPKSESSSDDEDSAFPDSVENLTLNDFFERLSKSKN